MSGSGEATAGTTMAVRLRRPAAGPDVTRILLLHGLGGSRAAWAPLSGHAGHHLELWEADLPWTGTGDPAWSYRADVGTTIGRAMRSMPGGAEVVVAHSFAANLLLEEVSRGTVPAPRALVLISPFYRPDPADFQWSTIEFYLHGLIDIVEEGLRISASPRLDGDVRRQMARRARDRIGPYGWMRFFDAYLRTPLLDLSELPVPVLVLAGADDRAATAQDATALAKGLPRGRLEILPGCGHYPMIEKPGTVAALIGDFLATLSRLTAENPRESR
ncbi:alpha/beta fold hydrolase [Jidongwangia harbinensis]|uniref:alpha/beta fold hydrolase n=1 Tax=Jidongwangia harbinensis TaxID=2878561 RepID=UPI001CD96220|nr:alpha/beta hydrolase [Jidongwangia harbinensis]MCA2215098.1 alpha/beta hydrolase [Jidongwangia harbinensis]